MSRLRLAAWALTVALTGCAGAERQVIYEDPPPPRDERPTKKPGTHVFWQEGHWAWKDGLYYWSSGGWEQERERQLWIPGYWRAVEEEGKPRGWEWVEPRWEEIPR